MEGAMSTRQFQPEQLEQLYEVARSIHESLEPAEAMQWVVQASVQLVGASSGSLALVNPTTGLL
jgi:GAF domain-containing protein